MSNSTSPVPNPETPLAFLPPDIARQLEIYRYVVVAMLGGYAWNLFANTGPHYKILFCSKITLSTVAYFVSILGTLIYTVGCVVFHIGHVGNCQTFAYVIGVGFSIAIPATTFLFLLRVCAVYNMDKRIVIPFSIFWLGTLACAITLPFAVFGAHIGPTAMCIDSGVRSYSSAGVVAHMVYDSLVFLAITYRILDTATVGDTFEDKARAFFEGGALPALSRCLLKSGQVYYLITVVGNVATTIMLLSPSVGPILHALLTVPNVAVMNAMACKVFRDVKFGNYRETFSLPSLPQTWCGNSSSLPSSNTTGEIQGVEKGNGIRICKEVSLHTESTSTFSGDAKAAESGLVNVQYGSE